MTDRENIMTTLKPWLYGITVCVLTLSGCTTQTHPIHDAASIQASGNPQTLWQQRQNTLARMSQWRLQSKVGIQFKEESAAFNLTWLQKNNGQYEMSILNPLTSGVVAQLNGSDTAVTLQANGKTYQAANAEHLLQNQLGVALPLQGMQYWIRGIPAPNIPIAQVKLDTQGRPEILQQAGWQIEYSGWQGNGWQALPEKINLSRTPDNTKVKVIAKEWQTHY